MAMVYYDPPKNYHTKNITSTGMVNSGGDNISLTQKKFIEKVAAPKLWLNAKKLHLKLCKRVSEWCVLQSAVLQGSVSQIWIPFHDGFILSCR